MDFLVATILLDEVATILLEEVATVAVVAITMAGGKAEILQVLEVTKPTITVVDFLVVTVLLEATVAMEVVVAAMGTTVPLLRVATTEAALQTSIILVKAVVSQVVMVVATVGMTLVELLVTIIIASLTRDLVGDLKHHIMEAKNRLVQIREFNL